jgi:hypothetical protein
LDGVFPIGIRHHNEAMPEGEPMRKQAKPAPENHTITVNFQEAAPMFACVRMVRRYSNGSLPSSCPWVYINVQVCFWNLGGLFEFQAAFFTVAPKQP